MSTDLVAGRIVCIGSRLVAEDLVGPAVFDRLRTEALPPGIEIVDGGLRGLDLLPFFEGVRRVVLVDALRGYARPGEAVVLRAATLADLPGTPYDHAGGLAYLLKTLPNILSSVPEILLVGIEIPADDTSLEHAAAMAVDVCCCDLDVAAISRQGAA